MIFVTVGSELPFSRLVKHLDHWSRDHPGHRLFAQVGHLEPSDYVPETVEWVEMLTADEFDRRFAEARLIVAHAGMGSIISALATGKPIAILPRRAQLREHRNDHQLATAERFANRSGVFVAWTEADLGDVIGQALAHSGDLSSDKISQFAPAALTERLRGVILGSRQPYDQ